MIMLYLLLALMGFAAQILQRLIDIRRTTDSSMTLMSYLRRWPYATALALMGSFGGLAALFAGDQVNAATAIMTGYAANAMFDSARAKTQP